MGLLKIACLSDTHSSHRAISVPEADIVIHAGDISYQGTPEEILSFCQWFGALPHRHKILVAGNHDWLFQRNTKMAKEMADRNGIHYLMDSGVDLMGAKFWGSPWQPSFGGWAFNLAPYSLRKKWNAMPEGIDVLITHGPPKGILDDGKGDLFLLKKVERVAPKLHVFGHIHEGGGSTSINRTLFVNASVKDENYSLVRSPVVSYIFV